MEVPGIVVGVYLGSRHRDKSVQWGRTLHEVITGKSILLLVGGLAIGVTTSLAGYMKVALIFPIFTGTLGVRAGHMVGLSIGGATILGVLGASASYIAAPATVSIGLPEANAPLALMSSIGVIFPFNLLIGIPLYLEIAKRFSGM